MQTIIRKKCFFDCPNDRNTQSLCESAFVICTAITAIIVRDINDSVSTSPDFTDDMIADFIIVFIIVHAFGYNVHLGFMSFFDCRFYSA